MHLFQICFDSLQVDDQSLKTVATTIATTGDQSDDAGLKAIVLAGTITRGFRPVPKDDAHGKASTCRCCIIFSGASRLGEGSLELCLRMIKARVGLNAIATIDGSVI